MLTIKYAAIGLLMSFGTMIGWLGVQAGEKDFVSIIETENVLEYFSENFDAFAKVNNIALYEDDTHLIYELNGMGVKGEEINKEAKVEKALLGAHFDYQIHLPCGCSEWGRSWKEGASYDCNLFCSTQN